MTGSEWVVVLEVADTRSTGGVSYESVQDLLGRVPAHQPIGLYSPDRYALQLVMPQARPAAAIDRAIELWLAALRDCGLPRWELVRAEVKTLAELEAELQAEAALIGQAGRPGPNGLHSVDDPGKRTERSKASVDTNPQVRGGPLPCFGAGR